MKKTSFNSNDTVQSKIDEFSKLDEDELVKKMFQYANDGKRTGEINNESLEKFYNTASSFLTEEQKQKMRKLIDSIKSS